MKSRFYTLYIKIRENDLACCCFCYLHKQEAQLSELSLVKLFIGDAMLFMDIIFVW